MGLRLGAKTYDFIDMIDVYPTMAEQVSQRSWPSASIATSRSFLLRRGLTQGVSRDLLTPGDAVWPHQAL